MKYAYCGPLTQFIYISWNCNISKIKSYSQWVYQLAFNIMKIKLGLLIIKPHYKIHYKYTSTHSICLVWCQVIKPDIIRKNHWFFQKESVCQTGIYVYVSPILSFCHSFFTLSFFLYFYLLSFILSFCHPFCLLYFYLPVFYYYISFFLSDFFLSFLFFLHSLLIYVILSFSRFVFCLFL